MTRRPTPERPIIRLTLRAESSPVPPFRSLARILKALLRQYGWRCLNIERLDGEGRT